ncbi:glycoside hydrolase family 52 protein [Paenibacillus montanisoli]|uniref:Beta-xylosidase n=1 Tax=Paenibacillus montanisoli TaxID=2081970 RepID=A0A328U5S9_9BACL|nr:glycoside hydrolase family 52 protein [Paenibacillus montanisoli]RAP77910.1 beta-xylosidase [Paenibacillus montanisoli]
MNRWQETEFHDQFYMTMHSPRGANASFALGAKDDGGGFLHDTATIPEQEIFIGVKKGNKITCLPFFKQADSNGEELYDQGAEAKKYENLLLKYDPSVVSRKLGFATDSWTAPGMKLEIATPVDGVPEPGKATAAEIKKAIVPAIPVKLTIDNRDGSETAHGIFGLKDLRGFYSAADRSPSELLGIITADGYGFAMDAAKYEGKVTMVGDFGPKELFSRVRPELYRLAPMGGFIVEVPPGETVTVDFVLGWYDDGFVTRGERTCKNYYTNYFSSINEVFQYAVGITDELWAEARNHDRRLEESDLNEEQQFLLAQAMHCYYASTMLFDDGGRARWVVNEGTYMMMNTFDLSVDHLFYETKYNPWAVKNQLDTYVDEYSYYDTVHSMDDPSISYPGGIAFTHDQGVFNTFSPAGYSAYELTNKDGCLSYMSHEELTNWILSAAVYFHAFGDKEWLERRKGVIADCLYSLLNRDHPDPSQRDGIMDFDSDRCGVSAEITTYDSLDASLGQSRRNLYLAVKCWASYLAIERLLTSVDQPIYAAAVREAKEAAMICAKTIVSYYDEQLGYIPALLDGKDRSAIIPAIEGLVYPDQFGMSEALAYEGEYGFFIHTLKKHFTGVFKPELCQFSDNGWRLSATSINSWMSKIFVCQYVARNILGIDFGDDQIVHDRAHAHWWKVPCHKCPGIDQIFWGYEFGRGFHYPRAITAILWLN